MNKLTSKPKSAKLIAVGNSTGLILPKEILASLNLQRGDEISLNRTPSGLEIRAYNAEFEDQMADMRNVMKNRRNALRELAK